MKKKSALEIGRRDFLRVVAITAGGGVIAACAPVAVPPTAAPGAQATAVPAATTSFGNHSSPDCGCFRGTQGWRHADPGLRSSSPAARPACFNLCVRAAVLCRAL